MKVPYTIYYIHNPIDLGGVINFLPWKFWYGFGASYYRSPSDDTSVQNRHTEGLSGFARDPYTFGFRNLIQYIVHPHFSLFRPECHPNLTVSQPQTMRLNVTSLQGTALVTRGDCRTPTPRKHRICAERPADCAKVRPCAWALGSDSDPSLIEHSRRL